MTIGDYLRLLAMAILALLFSGLSYVISRLLAPRKPTPAKLAAYECGIVPTREPSERFPVKFYLIAMVFVVFDIEIIFLYPWAVIFHEMRIFGFVEMLVFVGTLLFIYGYIWRRGILDWKPTRQAVRHAGEEVTPRAA